MIGETLANDTRQRRIGAVAVIAAERFAEAVTSEVKVIGARSADYMRQTNMEQMIFTWQSEVRKRDQERARHGERFPADPFA